MTANRYLYRLTPTRQFISITDNERPNCAPDIISPELCRTIIQDILAQHLEGEFSSEEQYLAARAKFQGALDYWEANHGRQVD